MEFIITTKNLTRRFKKQIAVNRLNLNVAGGEVYGFLGRNGAGKTTTIRMLLGLIRRSEGEIRYFGKELLKHKRDILPRIGSMIDFPGFYGNLTARENLLIHERLLGIQKKNALLSTLSMVGLDNTGSKLVKEFSLGMKQRLGIARAILHDPKILILDEPVNGLDPAGIKEIRGLIQSLAKEEGKTVFVSSHILSEVEQMADRIGIIHEGTLIEEITIGDLHSRNRKYLEIRVSDDSRAAFILEEKLKISDYEVYPNRIIRIYEKLNQAAQINRALVEANLEISQLSLSKDNLEDYFLEKTGQGAVYKKKNGSSPIFLKHTAIGGQHDKDLAN